MSFATYFPSYGTVTTDTTIEIHNLPVKNHSNSIMLSQLKEKFTNLQDTFGYRIFTIIENKPGTSFASAMLVSALSTYAIYTLTFYPDFSTISNLGVVSK
jgi:hypothetical protein